MKILTPGHKYELANHENPATGQILQFIEKQPSSLAAPAGQPPKLVTVNDGTTNEEVLQMLIDRLGVLMNRLPNTYTLLAAHHCECALMLLEQRTAERQSRGVENTPLL
jgi:hypothetical protein